MIGTQKGTIIFDNYPFGFMCKVSDWRVGVCGLGLLVAQQVSCGGARIPRLVLTNVPPRL